MKISFSKTKKKEGLYEYLLSMWVQSLNHNIANKDDKGIIDCLMVISDLIGVVKKGRK